MRILDLILLEGHKAIFSIGLALIYLMKDQIMGCKDISTSLNNHAGDMFRVLESSNRIFALSPHILFISTDFNITQSYVEKMRVMNTETAITEVMEYEEKRVQKEVASLKNQKRNEK